MRPRAAAHRRRGPHGLPARATCHRDPFAPAQNAEVRRFTGIFDQTFQMERTTSKKYSLGVARTPNSNTFER
jgi:hypothetical protein